MKSYSIIDMLFLIIEPFPPINYLFKYVNKGHDRVIIAFYEGLYNLGVKQCKVEINMFYNCKYLFQYEVVWKTSSFDISYRESTIERLSFYLLDEQVVVFPND